ncbi:MAG TPA: efflux RND transporter permease subunit [Crocinitomix sp.]|nr:efflux RND transporter permease subunit [Crocinitomix sp.]
MSKEVIKEFKLSTWSVKNRKTVYLITFIILFGGLFAYKGMPRENFPELQIPEIYIGVAYPGNSPELIAEKIANPIEKELNSIKNIDEISSSSINGFATITAKFSFNVTAKDALQEVKDAVDKARSKKEFPKDLPVEPNIFELDVSQMPVMNINLSGNYSVKELKEFAEILEEKIEDLQEISEVDIRGIQEQEMSIEIDRYRAEAANVSFYDIEKVIGNENITMSGGEILDGKTNRTVQIKGEFTSAEELGHLIVKQEFYKPVYLKDIAKIEFKDADITSYAREFGQPVVMLDVKKRGGENLLEASDKINTILATVKAQKLIPSDVNISVTNDMSDKTREMVSNLENSIYFGILLVVGVLLFFLGIRNALFVGIAIPLSMLMSFLILDAMDVTLNTMVLFSLVLALGMLVDNGIVIVENVYRLMDEGMDSFEAAKKGVGEVAWPIIASTATTLAAFVPLAIWPGIMGEFMKFLPITLMIVLGSSLFVALVINPVLTAVYMKVETNQQNHKKSFVIALTLFIFGVIILFLNTAWGNIFILIALFIPFNIYLLTPSTKWFQNKFLPWLENVYEKIINYSIKGKRPIWVFLGTFLMLVFSIILVNLFPPKTLFFPENQPNYVNIFIEHPIGTDISVTNQTTLQIENLLMNEILKDELEKDSKEKGKKRKIQSIIAQVGKGASDPTQGVVMGDTPHKGRITVNFTEFKYRDSVNETSYLMKKISNGLKHKFSADIKVLVDKNKEGPPQESPINIEISGEKEYTELIYEAEKIKNYLDRKNVLGVDKLKLNVETGKPELNIVIDREKARLFDVSTGQIASTIRTAIFGKDISTFKDGDDIYDINLRLSRAERNNIDALLDQKLIFMNKRGQTLKIPIRSLVKDPKPTNTYSTVVHKDLVPYVAIESKVSEGFNANEVVANLKDLMLEYEIEQGLPEGVSYAFKGQQEEQAKEMTFLSKALLIAVFLILLIIVAQFNAYSSSVIIMLAVVFSLIGVFLGLVVTQMEFVIMMTMIGIISLAGIVVNNAIVLIDYTNLLRKRKRVELGLGEFDLLPMNEIKSSIVQAGKTRLRPVLLTAITTVLGLIPLATGFNIDFTTLLSEYNPNIYIGGDNTAFFGPMSWTIIFGLTFATFLTLVVIPVMYLLFYQFKICVYKIFGVKIRTNL